MRNTRQIPGGFSLVEVTIAIGLFAFVMVGILGLFPTATKMRSESALETRAVMIAQQLFSYVETAGIDPGDPASGFTFSVTNVAVRDGPAFEVANTRTNINLTNPGGVVLGYLNRSSMPYYFFGTNAGAWTNMPTSVTGSETSTSENEITTMARVYAERITNTAATTNGFRDAVTVWQNIGGNRTNEATVLYFRGTPAGALPDIVGHQYRVVVEVRSPAIVPLLDDSGRTNPGTKVVRFVKFF